MSNSKKTFTILVTDNHGRRSEFKVRTADVVSALFESYLYVADEAELFSHNEVMETSR